ncbi:MULTISPECIES: hypothetical protein [Parafrankia]|nr:MULTISPECIES: hypothetical protein [Parafrankia]MCK9901744.1 hypothetical protein [Frankia sp. Cpl3]
MNRSTRPVRRIAVTIVATATLGLLTTAAGCQPGEPCPYPPSNTHRKDC